MRTQYKLGTHKMEHFQVEEYISFSTMLNTLQGEYCSSLHSDSIHNVHTMFSDHYTNEGLSHILLT